MNSFSRGLVVHLLLKTIKTLIALMTPLRFLQTVLCYNTQPQPLTTHKTLTKENQPTRSLVRSLLS